MKIENGKLYEVVKYTNLTEEGCGLLPGEDVKALLRGYKYDERYEMWFSPRANIGYSVSECN